MCLHFNVFQFSSIYGATFLNCLLIDSNFWLQNLVIEFTSYKQVSKNSTGSIVLLFITTLYWYLRVLASTLGMVRLPRY